MGLILVPILIVLLILYLIKNKGSQGSVRKESVAVERFPYQLKNNMLKPAECLFYDALRLYIGDQAVICPKVGLKDFIGVTKVEGNHHMTYFGKISQKHVDFIICDTKTFKPICVIDLKDATHKQTEKDEFTNKLYKKIDLPMIQFSTKTTYNSADFEEKLGAIISMSKKCPKPDIDVAVFQNEVTCPKCSAVMVKRVAAKGANKGNEFYGCSNYPSCKEIINL
jgi:hypothetical protein